MVAELSTRNLLMGIMLITTTLPWIYLIFGKDTAIKRGIQNIYSDCSSICNDQCPKFKNSDMEIKNGECYNGQCNRKSYKNKNIKIEDNKVEDINKINKRKNIEIDDSEVEDINKIHKRKNIEIDDGEVEDINKIHKRKNIEIDDSEHVKRDFEMSNSIEIKKEIK